jgi:hypothetical protein
VIDKFTTNYLLLLLVLLLLLLLLLTFSVIIMSSDNLCLQIYSILHDSRKKTNAIVHLFHEELAFEATYLHALSR